MDQLFNTIYVFSRNKNDNDSEGMATKHVPKTCVDICHTQKGLKNLFEGIKMLYIKEKLLCNLPLKNEM